MGSRKISRRGYLGATAAALLSTGAMKGILLADHASQASPGQSKSDQAPLAVGTSAQLFFDDQFIATSENVTITMNPPIKCGPVLKPDQPWEDFRLTSYFTVVQDGDLARMYYSCFAVDQWNNKDDPWNNHAFLCYAESKDGLNWIKPDLGIVEYGGSKKNNIVLKSVVDGTVFIDPTASPERRYKLLHTIGPHKGGLRVSYSADGKHFTTPDQPASPWTPDSQQNAFYDPDLKKYVAYLRAFHDGGIDAEKRSVARVVLDDIEKPWDAKPQIVFSADDQDPSDVDFYTNAAVKYPWADDAYFMFPAAYHHFEERYGNDGLLDSSAAVSRDGIAWKRPDRGPYVSLGEKGEWDESFVMMGVGLIRRGDKIFQYYNGIDIGHGGTRKESKLGAQGRTRWGWMGVTEQRLGGFYSADFAYAGGSLVTPPLVFGGNQLQLNVNTSSAGNAKVALLQPDGQPVPSYSIDDCDEIMTNNVAHIVTWKEKADLAALSGKPLRLRIESRSTKLYGFQFASSQ
ncbi:MAG: hypothetical protein ABIP55_12575 [Tepidisphaeraceae bacterium]